MNRKLFFIGVVLFSSMFVASFLKYNVNVAISLMFVILLPAICWALNGKVSKQAVAIFLITSSSGLFYYTMKNNFEFEKLLALNGKNIVVEGVITSYPNYIENGVFYNVKINKTPIKSINTNFNTTLFMPCSVACEPYSRFKAKVKVFSPYLQAPKNLKRYYKSKNQPIVISSYSDDDFIWVDEHNWQDYIFKYILNLKQYCKNNLIKCYNNNQGNVMAGILLGEKNGIDYNVKHQFSQAGISHLLAVSGLHLTILVQTIFSLMGAFKVNKNKKSVFAIIFVLIFVSLTGFAPSAVRAGVMNIIYLLGLLIKREPDPLNSLGLALILILISSPFSVMDVGLQLSFAATLGIIYLKPKVYNKLNKHIVKIESVKKQRVYQYVCEVVSVSISAMVLTVPITMVQFGQVSIIAPVTNVVLTPIIQPTLIFIMATALLGGVTWLTGIYKFCGLCSSIGISIIKGVARVAVQVPYAYISVGRKYIIIWMVFLLILILVAKYLLKNKNTNKYIALFSVIIILCGKISNDIVNFNVVTSKYIGTSRNNYIITKMNTCVLILVDDEKYLIANIDDEVKNMGSYLIKNVVVSEKISLKNIAKVIEVYRPQKLLASNKTISLLKNYYTNSNNVFQIKGGIISERIRKGRSQTKLQTLNNGCITVERNLDINVTSSFK